MRMHICEKTNTFCHWLSTTVIYLIHSILLVTKIHKYWNILTHLSLSYLVFFVQATPIALVLCYLIFVNTYALKVQSLLCYLSEYKNRPWENQLGQQLVYHMFCVCSYPRNLRNCLILWVQYRDWIKCSKWVTSINQWFSFVGMLIYSSAYFSVQDQPF